MSVSKNKKLTQHLISEHLTQQIEFRKDEISYVDSILKYRDTLLNKYWFDDADKVFSHIVLPEWKKDIRTYVIPNNLSNSLQYIHPGLNIEYDNKSYYFFSSLLPTKRQNIFVIQFYMAQSDSVEKDFRIIYRGFLSYKITGHTVTELDEITSDQDPMVRLPFRLIKIK